MGKKRGKKAVETDLASPISKEDIFNLIKAKELLLPLQEKIGIDISQIDEILNKELSLPVEIFSTKLTPLESISKYLKENIGFSFIDISKKINRDQRNVWNIYNNSKLKLSKKYDIKKSVQLIPISIFSSEKLSAMENLVIYLKDQFSLTYHEIAVMLKRDDRTIWTVYNRGMKRNETTFFDAKSSFAKSLSKNWRAKMPTTRGMKRNE